MLFSTLFLIYLIYNYLGDNMNKKVMVCSIILSIIFSFMVIKAYNALGSYKALCYFVQVGAYNNRENALSSAKRYNSSFIMMEDNLYKVYIGVAKSEEVYNKIVSLLNIDEIAFKKNALITDKDLSDKIDLFDKVISKVNSKDKLYEVLIEEVNNLYKYYDIELIF